MKRKIFCSIILCLLFFTIFLQKTYAKYILSDVLKMEVFVDKMPPNITITSNGNSETFDNTTEDVVKKINNVTIDTLDNIKIDHNEYYYNPKDKDFNDKMPTSFDNGQELTEEGYYKIVAVDTSGNQTEIIILLDKSAPDVTVKYYKKGEMTSHLTDFRKVVAKKVNLTTENGINIAEEENTTEEENVVENQPHTQEKNTNITAEEETEIADESENTNDTNTKITDCIEEKIVDENILDNNAITEENNIELENEKVEQEKTTNKEQNQMDSVKEENKMMFYSVSNMYVGNEAEFRNALANQAAIIHVRQSIDFTAPIYINYNVQIVTEGESNSLRYGSGGSFIVVQNGGALTLNGMVIDTNSSGAVAMIALNVQNGGYVTFLNSSIIDGGLGNIGMLINGGGSALLWSCKIVRCNVGINLQANGNLYFATQEGRCNSFYWNDIAVYIDNFYGNVNFNQNICMYDNSQYGIYIPNSGGTINISAGTYYRNEIMIRSCNISGAGSVNVSGGDYYENGWAIWAGGKVNFTGGSIHNNYNGVVTDNGYSGNFTMSGGNIYSNTLYAIHHGKTNDGGCTLIGGSISGQIYLATNDNYVNTNSSYVNFTVTPSSYYAKRKLVKTTSNAYANNEISKVTLTPKDSWYKYIESGSQYIVLWNGGNVIVRCKDYYGNILKTVTMNGTIGTAYSVNAPAISGYDIIAVPSNAKGTYTQNDIIVELKYDLVNVAKVNFEDVLSGVVSAKYWYNSSSNSFSGTGTDFANGMVFEKYGYYKVVVVNGVGLQKEITFVLNQSSYTR